MASPARSNHRGLLGWFFIETHTLPGFLWYFSSLLTWFPFFFSSEKEGPGSSRPNHPACGHTQPLLPVLPLKGSLGLGLETMGKPLGEASALTHLTRWAGRRGKGLLTLLVTCRSPHTASGPQGDSSEPRAAAPTEVSMQLKRMGRTARSEFQDQEAH